MDVSAGEKMVAAWIQKHPSFGKHGSRKIPVSWKCLQSWRRRNPRHIGTSANHQATEASLREDHAMLQAMLSDCFNRWTDKQISSHYPPKPPEFME